MGGVGLLTYTVAGCIKRLTPAAARSEQIPLSILTPAEARTLDALGTVLVPGSAEAGLVHYVDHQLAAAPSASMLMIKYLRVNPPFAPFYQSGLAAVDQAALTQFSRRFVELDTPQAKSFVKQMPGDNLPNWQGPPAGFLFFVLRADAVDVFYGTREGFAKLDVPYMAHIEPPSRWGA